MLSNIRTRVGQHLANHYGAPQMLASLTRLRDNGLRPELIFDIGANRGDFSRDCLRVWPDCKIGCFEPQQAILPKLRQFAEEAGSNVSVHPCLVGAECQDEVILYETDADVAASVLREHVNTTHRESTYPMKTIDHYAEYEFEKAPDLLKLDVQGYELETLKGACQVLPKVKCIIAEVNLIDIHVGVPLLADMVGWLDERGFVSYDICGLTRRPLDDALWQIDIAFVPRGNKLRADKRWAGADET